MFDTGTGTNACYMEKLERVELWDGDSEEPLQVNSYNVLFMELRFMELKQFNSFSLRTYNTFLSHRVKKHIQEYQGFDILIQQNTGPEFYQLTCKCLLMATMEFTYLCLQYHPTTSTN